MKQVEKRNPDEIPYLIVVADDDLDDQFIIKEAINETGLSHQLVVLKNGLELMDLLVHRGNFAATALKKPDLIIMDLNMPLLDGYGVLKQVKAIGELKDIPVYVLSTSRFEYDRHKSLDYGALEFFSKPYHFDDLKVIIKDICVKLPELVGTK